MRKPTRQKRAVEIGYKVFSGALYDEPLYPYMVMGSRQVYRKGVWNKRIKGNGPITAFRSHEQLRSYAELARIVYRVAYVPSGEYRGVWCTETSGRVVAHLPACALPKGTVLADAVYLLDEIRT